MSAEAEGPVFRVIEDESRVDCIVNTLGDLEQAVKELKSQGLVEDSKIFFYLGLNPVIAPVVWSRKPKVKGEGT